MTETADASRARPRAFRLDADSQAPGARVPSRADVTIRAQEDAYAREAAALSPDEAAVETAQQRGMRRRFGFT